MKYVSPQTEKRKQQRRKRKQQMMVAAIAAVLVVLVIVLSVFVFGGKDKDNSSGAENGINSEVQTETTPQPTEKPDENHSDIKDSDSDKENSKPQKDKKPKKKRRVEKISVVLYVCGNKVLLHKRKNEGLLAGLYEFTTIKEHKTKKDFKKCTYLGKYKHVFSHVKQ